jgi:hypothetical protein
MPQPVYTPGDIQYFDPFTEAAPGGETNLMLNVAVLTAREVDANGVLKPGVVLLANGSIVTAAAQTALGMVRHPIKVHTNNTTLATVTALLPISVTTRGVVNGADITTMLGTALTANELSALTAAGGNIIVR